MRPRRSILVATTWPPSRRHGWTQKGRRPLRALHGSDARVAAAPSGRARRAGGIGGGASWRNRVHPGGAAQEGVKDHRVHNCRRRRIADQANRDYRTRRGPRLLVGAVPLLGWSLLVEGWALLSCRDARATRGGGQPVPPRARVCSSSTIASIVLSWASGLSERLSIPSFTRNRANSG